MNDEQRKLVEDNHNLIYAILHKYNLPIDEFYGVAAIGLCKAAITFDVEKGYLFSTYACVVIKNELKLVFRRNASERAIPFDKLTYYQSVISDGDGKETELLDIIPDNTDIEADIIANETIKQVYGKLSERDRRVFDLLILGHGQKEIGNIVGYSQPYISRIKSKIVKLLKED